MKIPVRYPVSFEGNKEIDHIQKLNPDFVIVVAYGKILPPQLLNLKNTTFLNVHASLLPKLRGAAPIQRAIMNKDKETGISIMKIISDLDAGPVLIQSKLKITKEINYEQLSDKMSNIGSKLIIDALELIKNNKANFKEQDLSKVTYANKIKKSESKINWNEKAEKVLAKINAFHPNPGSWFEFSGARIKIMKAKEVEKTGEAGTILDDKMTIACSQNAIRILELKKEGKKEMPAEEYLKGNEMKIGQKIN